MDNSLKDKVLDSTDIVEVVGERVQLTRRGREFVGLCPFHPDHNPSLSVNPQKGIFKCWSCGAGGDVIRFVQLRDRVGFREALDALARRAGIELRAAPAERRQSQLREEIQAAVAWARRHFQRNLAAETVGRRAREYAAQRGLAPETIARHGLGLALDAWDDLLAAARRAGLRDEVLRLAGLVLSNENGKTYDRFRNRLIFPISDALGRPVAFGGRTLGDDPAKYLNSPETVLFSKSRVLYGLDLARRAIEQSGAVLVVEGYLDAVLLHQHGFENAVATLGTALTDAHAKVLRPLAGTIYLCFDGDEAGRRAADRAVELALRTRADVRVAVLPAGQDPADCVTAGGPAALEAVLKGARDALEFKWTQALSAFGAGGPRARRAAVEDFVQFVATISVAGGVDPLQQSLLTGRLSDLLGVSPDAVFELLAGAKRTVRRRPPGQTGPAVEMSEYEASIRGLPGGLVTAVESLLGLLLEHPGCWRLVDDAVAGAVALSQTWQRLYRLLVDAHEELGEYSMKDVIARCEDSALCELVGRARARSVGAASPAEHFEAARVRLGADLDALRMSDLRGAIRGSEDVAAYEACRGLTRGRESALAPEARAAPGPRA